MIARIGAGDFAVSPMNSTEPSVTSKWRVATVADRDTTAPKNAEAATMAKKADDDVPNRSRSDVVVDRRSFDGAGRVAREVAIMNLGGVLVPLPDLHGGAGQRYPRQDRNSAMQSRSRL